MTAPLWLQNLLALLSALWGLVREVKPYAIGALFQSMRDEIRRYRWNEEVRRDDERMRAENAALDDGALRDRVRERIRRGEYL